MKGKMRKFAQLIFLIALSALATGTFSAPVASFTAVNVCEGEATVFINTSTPLSGNIVLNNWDFGDGNGSAAGNPIHTFMFSGTFSVKLTVTDENGDFDSFALDVVVYPQPDLDFNITSIDQCSSRQFTFTNRSNIALGSINSFTWDFGDGSSTVNARNATYIYNAPGTYDVTLTAQSDQKCQATFVRQLQVFPEPQVDFVFHNHCFGESIQFVNNSQLSSGNMSYQWSFGDGIFSTEINPEHTYTADGNYDVQLTATTVEGECVGVLSQSISVHPQPTAGFTAQNECHGDNVSFTNTSLISRGNLTYNWNFGDANTSGTQDAQHQYASPGTYLVTLDITSDEGCTDRTQQDVTVHPLPIADFTARDVCLGDITPLMNISSISSGTMNFDWDFGDGSPIATTFTPSHVYSTRGDYDITLTVTTDYNCTDQITQKVTVFPQSVGGSVNGATSFCENDDGLKMLTLIGETGEVIRWESSTTGGEPWFIISSTINCTDLLRYCRNHDIQGNRKKWSL